jgi:hypothetical protein
VIISASVDTLAKKNLFFCQKLKINNDFVSFSFGAATQRGPWPPHA